MTPNDLRADIAHLRKERADQGIDSDQIMLVVRRDRPPTGRTVGLAGRYGPRGEIMNVKEAKRGTGFEVAAYFDCQKVLDWLDEEDL